LVIVYLVFGLLTKQNRDLWRSGDRRARAEVLGRQMIGMAATMYGLDLATEDVEDKNGKKYPKITGNGPSNFQVKKLGYLWGGNLILLHKLMTMEL